MIPRGGAVAQVTLVGERQAAVGREFVYRGPQPECRECRVKAACLNQDLGRRYRVLRVRDVAHACLLNEDRARVVEVEPAPPACSVPARANVEGSVVTYAGVVCAHAVCPNFRLCHPVGIEPGTRLQVAVPGKELVCPLGYELASAVVGYVA